MKKSMLKYGYLLAITFAVVVFLSCQDRQGTALYTDLGATATQTAGTLAGGFEVSPSGAAGYSIAIEVPPGINQVQPSLTMVYSSQMPDGKLGYGWDLQGIPTISRVGKIRAIDGTNGTVNYDANDRFALNGIQLINTQGNYGANGTVYYTEKTDHSRLTSFGTSGSGPQYFTMVTKDGVTYEFGNTADSRITQLGGQSVRVWAVNKVTDLNGNTIEFTYASTVNDVNTNSPISSEGQFYPTQISYTGNDNTGFAANRFVKFYYESRPDVSHQYVGGAIIVTAARLARISTFVSSTPVLQYNLSYNSQADATYGSQINNIVQSGPSLQRPATVFTYPTENRSFAGSAVALSGEFATNQGWNNTNIYPITTADVNGDGRTDIIGFRNGVQVATAKANGSSGDYYNSSGQWNSGFSMNGATWVNQVETPRYIVDLNADGLGDVLGVSSNGVVGALSNGSSFDQNAWNGGQTQSFFSSAQGWFDHGLYPLAAADVNGDMMVDLIGFKDGVQVALSTGSSFQNPTQWNGGYTVNQGYQADNIRIVADVNGDKMADVVAFAQNGVNVALSNGSSFVDGQWNNGNTLNNFGVDQGWNNPENKPINLADVNGDGLLDIVGFGQSGVEVAINSGTAFTTASTWISEFGVDQGWNQFTKRLTIDVNGDGLADVVGFGQNGVLVALSTGTGFTTSAWNGGSVYGSFGVNQGYQNGTNQQVVTDVTGDGLPDLLAFGSNNVNIGASNMTYPNLLNNITDGLGANYAINYAPLSNSSVYTWNSQPSSTQASALNYTSAINPIGVAIPTYEGVMLRGGFNHVVSTYTLSNNSSINSGAAFSYQYNFNYTNAVMNLDGRGWQGFATLTKEDVSLGNKVINSMYQQFPFSGLSYNIQRQCANAADPKCTSGMVIGNQAIDYLCAPGQACNNAKAAQPYKGVYQVLKAAHRTDKYNYGTYALSILDSMYYDVYGNMVQKAYLGYANQQNVDASTADNVYTLYKYDPDTTTNQLAFPVTKLVSSTANTSLLNSATCGSNPSFGSADFNLTTFTYTSARQIQKSCAWDNQLNQWASQQHAYDAYGNDTLFTDARGNQTSKIYESSYHTYLQQSVTPPDSLGNRLNTYYVYDVRSGQLAAQTGPNGNVKVTVYNDFGEQTAIQGTVPANQGVTGTSATLPPLPSATLKGNNQVAQLSQQQLVSSGSSIYYSLQVLQNWSNDFAGHSRYVNSYMDAIGRKVKEETEAEGSKDIIKTYTHNAAGQVLEESVSYFSTQSNAPKTVHTYDVYQRPVSITHPAGANGTGTTSTTFQYSWNGQGELIVRTANAGGSNPYAMNLQHAYFNGSSKVVQTTYPSDSNAVMTAHYDRLSRVSKVVSPTTGSMSQGLVDSVQFDSRNRRIYQQSPGLGVSTFAYNITSQLVTKNTPAGKSTYTVDALGRTLTQTTPDGMKIKAAYDNPSASNGLGRATASYVYNASGQLQSSYAFGYDNYGNQNSVTLSMNGQDYTEQNVFDPLSRVTQLTYPDKSVLHYAYNKLYLDSIYMADTTFAKYSTYSPYDKPGLMSFGNGANNQLGYNPNGQIVYQSIMDNAGTVLVKDSLERNGLSQITHVTDLAGGSTNYSQVFGYTGTRLTSANAAGTYGNQSFAYDKIGNLISKAGVTYAYTGQQVTTGSNGYSAQYNGSGNLTQRSLGGTTWTYTYDALNRMTNAQTSGNATWANFTYDYQGRRLSKAQNNGQTTLYISENYEITNFGNSGSQNTKYIVSPYGRVATVTTGSAPPAGSEGVPEPGILYIHQNTLQSTIVTTGQDGKLAARVVYLPYGKTFALTGANDFRYKFNGTELDNLTELYYMNARYYDVETGRFMTADTHLGGNTGNVDSWNRYAFALNNPWRFVDPSGHSSWWVDALMFAADAALIAVGVAAIVLTDGAAAPLVVALGAAAFGAGVSGAIYNLQHLGHQELSGWGISLAVGGVSGAITGGVGAFGGAALDAGVASISSTGWKLAALWGGRIALGAAAGGLSSIGGQMVQNLLAGNDGKPFYQINWWTVLETSAVGAVGGAIGAAAGTKGVLAQRSSQAGQEIEEEAGSVLSSEDSQASFLSDDEGYFADVEDNVSTAPRQPLSSQSSVPNYGTFSEEMPRAPAGRVWFKRATPFYKNWRRMIMPITFNTNKTVNKTANVPWVGN